VLRGSGVLADAEPETPAVELEHCRPVTGGEPVRLGAPEPGLAVGDIDTRTVHPQHRDESGALHLDGSADQSHRTCLAAGVDDRVKQAATERDGLGVKLVAGERQLGADDEP